MILGNGVDIVEIKRLRDAVRKYRDKFLNRIYTKRELEYSSKKKNPYQHLAARFAAKEAVYKAFGEASSKNLVWTNIEIKNDKNGRPYVLLQNGAKELMRARRVKQIIISISHTKNYAVASAILIGK